MDRAKVIEIREMVAQTGNYSAVAREVGLSCVAVRAIARGDSYPDIGGPRTHKGGVLKLTNRDVREIRCRAADGEVQSNLARDFNVSPSMISRIVNGKRRA